MEKTRFLGRLLLASAAASVLLLAGSCGQLSSLFQLSTPPEENGESSAVEARAIVSSTAPSREEPVEISQEEAAELRDEIAELRKNVEELKLNRFSNGLVGIGMGLVGVLVGTVVSAQLAAHSGKKGGSKQRSGPGRLPTSASSKNLALTPAPPKPSQGDGQLTAVDSGIETYSNRARVEATEAGGYGNLDSVWKELNSLKDRLSNSSQARRQLVEIESRLSRLESQQEDRFQATQGGAITHLGSEMTLDTWEPCSPSDDTLSRAEARAYNPPAGMGSARLPRTFRGPENFPSAHDSLADWIDFYNAADFRGKSAWKRHFERASISELEESKESQVLKRQKEVGTPRILEKRPFNKGVFWLLGIEGSHYIFPKMDHSALRAALDGFYEKRGQSEIVRSSDIKLNYPAEVSPGEGEFWQLSNPGELT